MAGSRFLVLLCSILLLAVPAFAQFQFFEQMFNGGGEPQQPQNAGSDSVLYRQNYEAGTCHILILVSKKARILTTGIAHCDKYLCPHTLSCVHFPHHCPCAFPEVEDKFELGDGSMVCVSKGGFREGEAARKIELARKGLL